jgi:hypothetical protein
MARQAGAHRKSPAAAPVVAEVRRLRERLAAAEAGRDQLADDNAALRALVVEMAGGESHAWCRAEVERARVSGDASGYRRGRSDEGRERDRAWNEAARPLASPGPSFAELEVLRWGPRGREHFADPRPGDFPGTDTAESAVA